MSETFHQGRFRYLNRESATIPSGVIARLPKLSSFTDPLALSVKDIRPTLALGDQSPYTLGYHGFTARHEPSRLHSAPYDYSSWADPELLKKFYLPEVEALIKRVTNCSRAVVESVYIRNKLNNEIHPSAPVSKPPEIQADEAGLEVQFVGFSDVGGGAPAPKVHLDYTPTGARLRIRKHCLRVATAAEKVIEAENKLLSSGVGWDELKDHCGDEGRPVPRFAIFSVWRPLKHVRRDPIAVSTMATFPATDTIYFDSTQHSDPRIPRHLSRKIDPSQPQDDESGSQNGTETEVTHTSGNVLAYPPSDAGNGHDWHFISQQTPEDVLIIQLFDNHVEAELSSAAAPSDGMPPIAGAMHSSFDLEGQDTTADTRESMELRVMAFW